MCALQTDGGLEAGPRRRFEFDCDRSKGCALCVSECPCGAVVMEAQST